MCSDVLIWLIVVTLAVTTILTVITVRKQKRDMNKKLKRKSNDLQVDKFYNDFSVGNPNRSRENPTTTGSSYLFDTDPDFSDSSNNSNDNFSGFGSGGSFGGGGSSGSWGDSSSSSDSSDSGGDSGGCD